MAAYHLSAARGAAWRVTLLACLLGLFDSLATRARADEPLPALHEVIDQHIAAGWQARGATPAEPASDAEFLRRITLDLTGTIPTAAAARKFLDDASADKRGRLIDELLASSEYARHMQHVFDVMLLERQHGNYVTEVEWRDYLRTSFVSNKPWDQMVRELVGTDGADPAVRPAIRFFTVRTIDSNRVLSPTSITRDMGRLLLGMNLQCAQCHDHPSIDSYKQADYHGILAFVNRSYFVEAKLGDKNVMMIAEKPEGAVKFISVFDPEKKEHVTQPRLPGGPEFIEPKFSAGEEYKVKPAPGVVPVPAFSPRAHLVQSLTSPDNVGFKRNIANRLWLLMLGRGLVHPPDLHHVDNAASHPELLAQLADRFAADGFNIKKFLREIALSKTYQLSGTPAAAPAAAPQSYAAAAPRMLRPEQLAFAVMQATGHADAARIALGDKLDEPALYAQLQGAIKPFVDLYGRPPGQAENSYDPSLFQALFLSNDGLVMSWLEPRAGNLVDRLSKLAEPAAVAEELYLSVYSRRPIDEEMAAVTAHLQDRAADRVLALQELAWAMIASAEFRFNH